VACLSQKRYPPSMTWGAMHHYMLWCSNMCSNGYSSCLLPLLRLHLLCAGSSGDVGSPGYRWSASMLSVGVNGCLQMWHCVAVALTIRLACWYLYPYRVAFFALCVGSLSFAACLRWSSSV